MTSSAARAARHGLAGLRVSTAYLGHAPPSPGQVLGALPGGPVVVLPLLLTGAYHSKTDLPAVLRAASARSGGRLEISYGDPLGPHPLLVTALERRLAEAGVHPGDPGTSVVLAAAGSGDPQACAAVARLAARWRVLRGWQDVLPAYASAAAPPPGGAVSALLAGGARRVVVASYLLAPGRFAEQVRDEAIAAGAADGQRAAGGRARAGRHRAHPVRGRPRREGRRGRPDSLSFMTGPRATHEVLNQPPPLTGHDVAQDPALLEALSREGAGAVAAELHELGVLAGSAQTQEQARLANDCVPRLRTHDRYGHRIDEVDYHPAWHALMSVAVSHGLHAAPWADGEPGAHLARAAKFYVWSQAEAGHSCPVSMTYAAVPALRHAPELARRFEPLLASRVYDPGLRAPETKAGLLSGMAMTEKQGGSDVRASTTRAEPAPSAGPGAHLLTGHKWFNSAPMCDLFLVLAQGQAG